ncbi:hypothetical protein ASPVEDRAFT_24471 [Aspergillus versicolor CBS 583.65]|uniref:Uncharacterized protein n=1 Tax=Aspergillus versicolor CBS 583.65 TaxID=1036611 RepID=A0A1L9P7K1_ASPVE|nr:uncharacterized protein ASPVEDRAFT_24471 [Aspergillus versicolor CBS 583.65]OJI97519.1 hypothetical protein ASPVEDRAFT_24471 [Aspergillus versicolor CBS 583.65]
MTPTTSWPSLLLGFTLLFSPLATSIPLPLPAKDSNCNNLNPSSGPETGLQPRSPIPDPRMIPGQTDGVARILAGLGLEKLANLNKLNPEEDTQEQEQEQAEKKQDAVPIDDSKSNTPTVTAHDNEPPVDNQSNRVEPVHGNNKQTTESAKPKDNEKAKDANSLNPATNTDGYLDSLFEKLRTKIREAFNSSDEVTLN